jgi:heme-degrading monooxygenase HmoA
MELAGLFTPPYYAVIFSSLRTEVEDGYAEMAAEMERLGAEQPGFLGLDSARSGIGITVSYWRTLEDLHAWKAQARHRLAQQKGRELWYESYVTRVARVEYEYRHPR